LLQTGGVFSITGFFDQDITIWKFKIPRRILVPLIIVFVAKIVGSVFIYYSMNVGAAGTFWSDPSRVFNWEQNKALLQPTGIVGKWPLVFVGWDSAWYLSIINRGYVFSPQSYTFMPGLPFSGYLFNLVIQDPLLAIAICALTFGVLWVPFYQLIVEDYIGKRAALISALLLAFSPYLFVFTTVAYGEGLFLFFTLSGWYLFKKSKNAGSSLLGGVAALTRVMGILLVLPMLYSSIRQKDPNKTRKIILSVLPVAAVAIWLGFCQISSGDFFASVHTTEWGGLYTVPSFLLRDLPQMGLRAFFLIPLQSWPALQFWLSPIAMFLALAVPPFLIYRLTKIDGALALYSLAGYLGFLVFGAIVSAPRFASVLFPLWIPLTAKLTMSRKHVIVVSVIIAAFFVIAVDMWINFLNGQFIA
jgi:hypothetical protein